MFNSVPSRIKYIDGLRALAVLSVLLFHAIKPLPGANWAYAGRHGVDLFFVISGFCLSYPILEKIALGKETVFDLPSFFAKRIVRIIPPYYVAAIAFIVLTIVLVTLRIPLPDSIQATTLSDMLKQFFFFDYNSKFSNGSFWTLAVEFRWYLLFPLMLWLWVSHKKTFWLIAAACAATYHFTRFGIAPGGVDFVTLPAFMFGIWAADIHIRRNEISKYALWALPVLMTIAFLTQRHEHAFQDSLLWQIISLCIVVAVGRVGALTAIFSSRLLAPIGIASYSIYLYHEPIEAVLEQHFGYGWLSAAIVAFGVGVIAWMFVERPLQTPAIKSKWVPFLKNVLTPVLQRVDAPLALAFAPNPYMQKSPTNQPPLISHSNS